MSKQSKGDTHNKSAIDEPCHKMNRNAKGRGRQHADAYRLVAEIRDMLAEIVAAENIGKGSPKQ